MRIAAKHGEEGVCQGAALAIKGITIAVFALNESVEERKTKMNRLATIWSAAGNNLT